MVAACKQGQGCGVPSSCCCYAAISPPAAAVSPFLANSAAPTHVVSLCISAVLLQAPLLLIDTGMLPVLLQCGPWNSSVGLLGSYNSLVRLALTRLLVLVLTLQVLPQLRIAPNVPTSSCFLEPY
jgi:hypothetical protein